jgi:2-polyprenyl-3-methyl-5-hydroxy-6-metoxy-1,4-benzoquinol methylase
MNDRYISDAYRALNRELHESPRGFGHSGAKHAESVAKFARMLKATSLLDYGCGAGCLAERLRQLGAAIEISEYDPAVPKYSQTPSSADLVVCTDVLEHVEPDRIDAVVRHIGELANKGAYLCISTQPAHKTLSDGRNAHLIVQPPSWWKSKFQNWETVYQSVRVNDEGDADLTLWLRH